METESEDGMDGNEGFSGIDMVNSSKSIGTSILVSHGVGTTGTDDKSADSESSDDGALRRRSRIRARSHSVMNKGSESDEMRGTRQSSAVVIVEDPDVPKATNRKRLVMHESDDSDQEDLSSPNRKGASARAQTSTSSNYADKGKDERKRALAALAIKKKSEEAEAESDTMEPANSRKNNQRDGDKKRKKHVDKSQKQERSSPVPTVQECIAHTIQILVATAALAGDSSFTRGQCKEKLRLAFGSDALEQNSEFIREQFNKIVKHCHEADKKELKVMSSAVLTASKQADKDSSSEVDSPIAKSRKISSKSDRKERATLGNPKSKRKEKGGHEEKSKHHNANERLHKNAPADPVSARRAKLTLHLEKIIAHGSLVQDMGLTKRGCRKILEEAISTTLLEEDLDFVNSEISRITSVCKQMDTSAVQAWAEQTIPAQSTAEKPDEEEEGHADDDSKEDPGSAGSGNESSDSGGSASSTSVSGRAAQKKPRRPTAKVGVLAGMVVVPTGKEYLKNPDELDRIKALLELHGAKVQSTVTRKVNYVVVARSAFIAHGDSRVASARKYGAKVVKASFFEECVRLQSTAGVSYADHAAVHAEGRSSKAKSSSKQDRSNMKKAESTKHAGDSDRDGETDIREGGGDGDLAENENDDGFASKNSRRTVARRNKEDLEWSKDVRARFSYVKDARSRAYDRRDPVVAGATLMTHKGLLYNAYLTQTDFDVGEGNDEDGVAKFYAIKLVEAGGLMKGERWHLVTQWGKVGVSRPGCDVTDFDDLEEAVRAFEQRFWEKTRNAWVSAAVAFRTVSGKYTMEELSDEEDGDSDVSSGDEGAEMNCQLEYSVRRLVSRAFSRSSAEDILQKLGVNTDKLNSRRLRRNIIHEAFSELASIQRILQRVGGSTTGGIANVNGAAGSSGGRAEKDAQRIKSHSDRFGMLLHIGTARSEEGEEAAPSTFPAIDTPHAVQERIRMVETLSVMAAVTTTRKRYLQNQQDGEGGGQRLEALYAGLNCRITPLSASSPEAALIARALADTSGGAAVAGLPSLRLVNAFSARRAGDDARFAGFARLPNRMVLWHAVRSTSLVSVLSQGLCTAQPEAPAVGYPLGKGLYFYDCPAEAVAAAGLIRRAPAEYLLLCEVALGNAYETRRPAYVRRAPHGYHSTLAKGRASHDPAAGRTNLPLARGVEVEVVTGPPLTAFGTADSTFRLNQYVVYDVAQVRVRYICQTDVVPPLD